MSVLKEKVTATGFAIFFAIFGGFIIGNFQEIGSTLELEFRPHSSPRTIVFQKRYAKTLCWTQQYDKYRSGSVAVWNLHLSDDLGHNESFTPMRPRNLTGTLDNPAGFNTGEPPSSTEETPVQSGVRTSFCVDIPSWVKPMSTLTVSGGIAFNGPMIGTKPLWMNYIQLPNIYFPPYTGD